MKRITIITLLLVLISAVGVSAEENPFWNFTESANLDYELNQGEVNYFILPTEKFSDGLDQSLTLNYGVHENTEIGTQIYHNNNFLKVNGYLKYNFLQKEEWKLSAQGNLLYGESFSDNYLVTSGELLVTREINDNLTVDGVTEIILNANNLTALNLEKGVTYAIDEDQTLKGKVQAMVTDARNIDYTLEAAYKASINDKADLTFNLYKDFDKRNLQLTNVVEVNPMETLDLRGVLTINTDQAMPNSFNLGAEKALNEKLSINAGFTKVLAENGYYGLKTGINYEL